LLGSWCRGIGGQRLNDGFMVKFTVGAVFDRPSIEDCSHGSSHNDLT